MACDGSDPFLHIGILALESEECTGRSVGCRVVVVVEREELDRSMGRVVDVSPPFGDALTTLPTRGGDRLHRDRLSGDDEGALIIATGAASSG